MRRGLLVCLLLFLSCIPSGASETVGKRLGAVAGYALFRSEVCNPYVELFYQVDPATLHYKKDSLGRLSARFQMRIRVTSDTGVAFQTAYYLQTKPFRPEEEAAPRILEQERFALPEGHFVAELYLAEDAWPDQSFYYRDTFSFIKSTTQYSTLELLDTAFVSSKASAFAKRKMQVFPRPLNFYDEGQQTVNTYFELYEKCLSDLPEAAYPLRQSFYISREKEGRFIPPLSVEDTITAPANLHYFFRQLSTASLPTGNYWANVVLRSASGVRLAASSTFFQTINQHPIAEKSIEIADSAERKTIVDANLLDLGKTFVAKFNMPQMRAILKMLRPGAGASDEAAIHAFLDRPDDLYMRYFIYNHFVTMNPKDPEQAWKEFADLVRSVNHQFGSGGTPGYETDRGIVYLRYGKPDEQVRVPNEAGALPYEIWRYNPNPRMHGPGLFLFYSPGAMSSDFRLLHSTVIGETQNPSWREMLYSTGHSSGNLNARAEEYFGKQ